MPFHSEAQRRYMFSQHPEIAKRWVAEGKGYIQKKGGVKTMKFPADGKTMKKALKGVSAEQMPMPPKNGKRTMGTEHGMYSKKKSVKKNKWPVKRPVNDNDADDMKKKKSVVAMRWHGKKRKAAKRTVGNMDYKTRRKGKNWIVGAIKHPGALRRTAGVKGNRKIPAGKLNQLANRGGVTGRRARLAQTLRGLHHKSAKARKQ